MNTKESKEFLQGAEADALNSGSGFAVAKTMPAKVAARRFKLPIKGNKYVPMIGFSTLMTALLFAAVVLPTLFFPFAFVSAVLHHFDTISESNSVRSTRIIRTMFDNSKKGFDDEVYSNNKKAALNRAMTDENDFTAKQKKKLKKLGIEVEMGDGAKMRKFFITENGVRKQLNSVELANLYDNDMKFRSVLDSGIKTVDSVNWEKHLHPVEKGFFNKKFHFTNRQLKELAKQGIEYDRKGKKMHFTDRNGKIHQISADEFDNFFKINSDFRNRYLSGSMTWRGRFSAWSGSKTDIVLKRLGGNLRNKFVDFDPTEKAETRLSKLKERMLGSRKGGAALNDGTDDEGRRNIGELKSNETGEVSSVEGKVDAAMRSVAPFTGVLQALNLACNAMMVLQAVQALISSEFKLQTISLAGAFLEAVDKTKAGDGSASPLPDLMEKMVRPDENGKSAINSYGVRALFDPEAVISEGDKESVAMAGGEGLLSGGTVARKFGIDLGKNPIKTFQECIKIRAASAVVSAVVSIFSGGLSGVVAKVVIGSVAALGLGMAIDNLSEYAVKKLEKKVVDLDAAYFGDEGGNSLVAGAHDYNGTNAQGGGQTLASEAKLAEYQTQVASVAEAERRKYEIETRSPFDVNSQYTFLGSILFNSMPVLSRLNSGSVAVIASINNLALKSVGALSPKAAAMNKYNNKRKGDCPLLESVGGTGDPYCVPYRATDATTIDMEPKEVFEVVNGMNMQYETSNVNLAKDEKGNETDQCAIKNDEGKIIEYEYQYSSIFERDKSEVYPGTCEYVIKTNDEGNMIINKHSELGAYARFCGQRETQFGMVDANIASWVKNTDFVKGELSDVAKALSDSALASGVIGAIPVIGDIADAVDAARDGAALPWSSGKICVASDENPDWSRFKYYQRYVEDQNLFENMGVVKKSAVSEMLGDIDNSRGVSVDEQIARRAGMTLAQYHKVLDELEYAISVAEYNSDGRAPLVFNKFDFLDKIGQSRSRMLLRDKIAIYRENIIYRARKNVVALG